MHLQQHPDARTSNTALGRTVRPKAKSGAACAIATSAYSLHGTVLPVHSSGAAGAGCAPTCSFLGTLGLLGMAGRARGSAACEAAPADTRGWCLAARAALTGGWQREDTSPRPPARSPPPGTGIAPSLPPWPSFSPIFPSSRPRRDGSCAAPCAVPGAACSA